MNKVQYTKMLIENLKKAVALNESTLHLPAGPALEKLAAKYKIKPASGKLRIQDFDGQLDKFSDRDLYDFCTAYADVYMQFKFKMNFDDIPNMMKTKNPILRAIVRAESNDLDNIIAEIEEACHDKIDALDNTWYRNYEKGIVAKKQPK